MFDITLIKIDSKTLEMLGKGLKWIIDSIVDRNINIWKYKMASASIYIKLPKQLDHLKVLKILMIMNVLNGGSSETADYNTERIWKIDKDFAKKLILKT